MTELDNITIIAGAAVVLLAILGSLVNPLLRKLHVEEEEEEEEGGQLQAEKAHGCPPVTVLVTAHDNLPQLERNLPGLLAQDYPDYQVVVVCQSTDGETHDLLKRLQAEHPQLYYTYIPATSRYMSRKKLQITVGVKAARHEWIVLTEPDCRAGSDQWLRAMTRQLHEPNHLVLGYVALDGATCGYRRFESIRTACYLLRRAQRSYGYRSHMPLVAFRKSDFMAEDGFLGSLHLVRGEYDFLVNKYAAPGQTAVELALGAWLTREEMSDKAWHNAHLYLLASRGVLSRYGSMRRLHAADHLLPHLSLLCSLAALGFGLLTERWGLTAAAGLALLLLFVLRMLIARRAVKRFDASLATFLLPFYEYSLVWRSLAARLRYWRADKNDFTSHKL